MLLCQLQRCWAHGPGQVCSSDPCLETAYIFILPLSLPSKLKRLLEFLCKLWMWFVTCWHDLAHKLDEGHLQLIQVCLLVCLLLSTAFQSLTKSARSVGVFKFSFSVLDYSIAFMVSGFNAKPGRKIHSLHTGQTSHATSRHRKSAKSLKKKKQTLSPCTCRISMQTTLDAGASPLAPCGLPRMVLSEQRENTVLFRQFTFSHPSHRWPVWGRPCLWWCRAPWSAGESSQRSLIVPPSSLISLHLWERRKILLLHTNPVWNAEQSDQWWQHCGVCLIKKTETNPNCVMR